MVKIFPLAAVCAGFVLLTAPGSMTAAPAESPAAREAGAKWETSEPVREGMKAIRDIVLENHTLITHRRMPPARARSMAAEIKRHVETMSANMALPPDADAAARALLTRIVEGADAIAGGNAEVTQIDGVVDIDAALRDYAERFDHPGWQPLR